MNAALWVRRVRPLIWVTSAVVLILVVGWQVREWSPSPGDAAANRAFNDGAEPGVDVYPRIDRTDAPELKGTTLDGEPLALADFEGKVVVINVWGSWCGPCRAETPDLVRLAQETKDQGVQLLGVNTRDNLSSAQAFVKKFKVPYPSLFDDDGQLLLPLGEIIPTAVIPSTVVVDLEGRIAARVIGPVDYTTLNSLLEDELAGVGR